ncbi:MAG: VRR-NUC domain-containing protein, partial [Bdellovibrionota bacterium]
MVFLALIFSIVVGFLWFHSKKKKKIRYREEALESHLKDENSALFYALKHIDHEAKTESKPKDLLKQLEPSQINLEGERTYEKISKHLFGLLETREELSSRKLFFKAPSTDEPVQVERFAGLHFEGEGYTTAFAECHIWNFLWYYLFFDIYWSSIPAAGFRFNKKGDFVQDMPADFYNGEEFYHNRERAILHRFHDLEVGGPRFALQLINKNRREIKFRNCRIANSKFIDIDRYNPQLLFDLYIAVSLPKLFTVLLQLLFNQNEFRKGLPDLFVYNPDKKISFFCEVKSENDKLSGA